MPAGFLGLLHYGCALLAGAVSALSFGSHRGWIWVVAPLSLAILFELVRDASPRRAAALGYLYGAGLFGVGLNWTHTSLHNFGGLALAPALGIALTFAAFLALFPAVACALGRWRAPAAPLWLALLRLAAAWGLLEQLRGWVLTGFGWLAAGYSQVPRSPLAGYVPVIGVAGVTFLAAVCGALVVAAMNEEERRRQLAPVGALVLLLMGGLLLRRVEHTERVDELAVSVLQGAVPQEHLWLRENFTRTPEIYAELAARADGRLMVAPETALPFVWSQAPDGLRSGLTGLAQERDATLIFGSFERAPDSERTRNAAVILEPGAEQVYAKRHLTPYGEYLPFADLLEPILDRARIPYSNLSPGSGDGIIELPFARLGMSICYESLFPSLFRAPPAQLLVNITNDSWFDGSLMPVQHLQIAAARALETRRWLLRASNTGPSAVIDHRGRIRRWVAPKVRKSISTIAELRDGATPYSRLGDWPLLIAVAAILLWRGGGLRRRLA